MGGIEDTIRNQVETFNLQVEKALSASPSSKELEPPTHPRKRGSSPPSPQSIERKEDVTFNLTVDPTWVNVLDDQILLALSWELNPKIAELHQRIRNRHQGEDIADMTQFINDQLKNWMVGKSEHLKRIANVTYTLEIPGVGGVAGVEKEYFSGPDIWLGLDKMGE